MHFSLAVVLGFWVFSYLQHFFFHIVGLEVFAPAQFFTHSVSLSLWKSICYSKLNQIYLEPKIRVSASEGFTISAVVNPSEILLFGMDRCAIDATQREHQKYLRLNQSYKDFVYVSMKVSLTKGMQFMLHLQMSLYEHLGKSNFWNITTPLLLFELFPLFLLLYLPLRHRNLRMCLNLTWYSAPFGHLHTCTGIHAHKQRDRRTHTHTNSTLNQWSLTTDSLLSYYSPSLVEATLCCCMFLHNNSIANYSFPLERCHRDTDSCVNFPGTVVFRPCCVLFFSCGILGVFFITWKH